MNIKYTSVRNTSLVQSFIVKLTYYLLPFRMRMNRDKEIAEHKALDLPPSKCRTSNFLNTQTRTLWPCYRNTKLLIHLIGAAKYALFPSTMVASELSSLIILLFRAYSLINTMNINDPLDGIQCRFARSWAIS